MDAADIIEIHQLVATYGHAIDVRDWDWFRSLFLREAEMDYTAIGADRVLNGVEEIIASFRDTNHPSAHHAVNLVVSERHGEIHVISKWIVPYTRATHEVIRWAGGDYDDTVVRTADGWKFRRKTCTRRWQMTLPEPGVEIPERRRTF